MPYVGNFLLFVFTNVSLPHRLIYRTVKVLAALYETGADILAMYLSQVNSLTSRCSWKHLLFFNSLLFVFNNASLFKWQICMETSLVFGSYKKPIKSCANNNWSCVFILPHDVLWSVYNLCESVLSKLQCLCHKLCHCKF